MMIPKPNHKRRKPKMKQRTRITNDQYQKALEEWGKSCWCGDYNIQMHHVRFRSKQGKGLYRNLHPLCEKHHFQAHQDENYRKHLEVIHIRKYGRNYWMDQYDLYENGLITEPTEELLEEYFRTIAIEKSR